MTTQHRQDPIIIPPGGGQEFALNGGSFVHKVNSKDTNGVFSVIEIVTPPNGGIDVHVHENEDELVFLLEGVIEVTLGDQKMKAVPGIMALLPRGIPHGFVNIGDTVSRLSVTIMPGEFDNYFLELSEFYNHGKPTSEQVSSLSDKYSIKYL